MGVSLDIEVKGLDKVLRFFDELERNVVDELDTAAELGAQLVHDTAITLVPVRTGNLKSTIEVVKEQERERKITSGGRQAPYAPYVEYGTYEMAAQPYMLPALEARRQEIRALVKGIVGRILRT